MIAIVAYKTLALLHSLVFVFNTGKTTVQKKSQTMNFQVISIVCVSDQFVFIGYAEDAVLPFNEYIGKMNMLEK
jgi:hypothetical protein